MPSSDAKATLLFAILNTVAETAHLTGLRAGPAADQLTADILNTLFAPAHRWAVAAYLVETEEKPHDCDQ